MLATGSPAVYVGVLVPAVPPSTAALLQQSIFTLLAIAP